MLQRTNRVAVAPFDAMVDVSTIVERSTVEAKYFESPARFLRVLLNLIWYFAVFVAMAAFIALPGAARAQKTDVVVIKKGGQIIGEIKGLQYGKLELSTGAMQGLYRVARGAEHHDEQSVRDRSCERRPVFWVSPGGAGFRSGGDSRRHACRRSGDGGDCYDDTDQTGFLECA
jgi:hypothetical protein